MSSNQPTFLLNFLLNACLKPFFFLGDVLPVLELRDSYQNSIRIYRCFLFESATLCRKFLEITDKRQNISALVVSFLNRFQITLIISSPICAMQFNQFYSVVWKRDCQNWEIAETCLQRSANLLIAIIDQVKNRGMVNRGKNLWGYVHLLHSKVLIFKIDVTRGFWEAISR